MTPVCRCCRADLEYGRIDVLVSRERPRPNMHASGRVAAVACENCADDVVAGVLHVATLWTPDEGCMHHTAQLF